MAARLEPVSIRLKSFGSDARGTTAVLFGLLAVVLMELVGAGIDFGRVYATSSQLQGVADSAGLSAVGAGSPGYLAASALTSDGQLAAIEADVVANFRAQITHDHGYGYVVESVTAHVEKRGTIVSSRVDFRATVPTYFLGLAGLHTIDVAGGSSATNGLPAYIDFHMLLDNSPSMGVAATPADIARMVANTPDQCAFACHDLSGRQDYYTLAKRLGVTTRIDVLRQATQKLMTTALTSEVVPDQFRVAINTFSMDVKSIFRLSPDLGAARTAANAIDLVPVPYQGHNNDRYTNFEVAMPNTGATIATPGSGAAPGSAQQVLFLVSDGVADEAIGNGRVIEPMPAALCTQIKNRGIKLAVLYTTYLPLPTNAFYNANVKPFSNQIGPKMQACASPGYYFEVSPTQGIDDAMKALFLKIVGEAHITG